MTNNEKVIEEAVAKALSESDDRNHEDLCHCGSWPATCITYGDRKPWSHDAESVARAAALTVFEAARTPKVIERHDLVMPIYEDEPPQSIPEKYIDALYSELRAKDVRLTWTELQDSLEAVSHLCVRCGEDPEDCACEGPGTGEGEKACGDYPAPCNCDNPETHGGHR